MTEQFVLGDQLKGRAVGHTLYYLNGTTELTVLKMGSKEQPVLKRTGDRVAIDWGYAYLAAESNHVSEADFGLASDFREQFAGSETGNIDARNGLKALMVTIGCGVVGSQPVSRTALVAYDELLTMDFFGQKLQPAWYDQYESADELLQQAIADHDQVLVTCLAFDGQLIDELTDHGGADYALIGSLAYRQTTAACALTRAQSDHEAQHRDGTNEDHSMHDGPAVLGRYFIKEQSSDGDVSTVDVFFPASPFFLKFNPDLLWHMVRPVLEYANNDTDIKYNKPFAPHHLGTWPVANIEPAQQEDMPNEETANLLLILGALAQQYNTTDFLSPYLPLLRSWVDFLIAHAVDPGNQLCTDDFMGPSPHNANLAAKSIVGMCQCLRKLSENVLCRSVWFRSIVDGGVLVLLSSVHALDVGLAAYGLILDVAGNSSGAAWFADLASRYAANWTQLANDGDHSKLEYNKSNTWSLKYNLLWQDLLGVKVFPPDVIQRDLEYYQNKHLLTYGVPLDVRAEFTKLDWESWVGAMGSKDYFQMIMSRIAAFARDTASHQPMGDWYYANNSTSQSFTARPVVGAVFARLLLN